NAPNKFASAGQAVTIDQWNRKALRMRLRLKHSVLFALLCLWSGAAAHAEGYDPLGTEAELPLKPAVRIGGALGGPCADAKPDHALDLMEIVNLALCSNPQTREIWASARVQAAQLGVSRGSYLPSVSLSVSDNRNGAAQRSYGLTLSYLLYDFGTRAANLENARQLFAAASATRDNVVQSIFLAAVRAFYQAQATRAALDAAQESERAAKQSFSAAEARYQAGSATPADKLQAQTAWSQATLNRITAEGNLGKANGGLANIIGLEPNHRVVLDTENSGSIPVNFERDVNSLIAEAKQRRPDLIAAEAQVKAAEASADAARAAGKPSLSLTTTTTLVQSGGTNSRGSSVGVNLSVPLFSGYGPTYRIRAAEAQVEAQQAQKERLSLQVALDVWNAYQDLITATQSLRTTADLLNSAEQSWRVALGRYQAGVGSMLDVLTAQSALASARGQRIQSTLNWNVSRATLAQAMGTLDESLLQTLSPAVSHQEQP
ncbi:MAG TPA: TolC family protein, partial [Gallionella sp.]|nr:TolC family protein [Gallionella sp.]